MVINAGRAGTAWSGGDAWADPELAAALTGWVHKGGVFLGVGEPSALPGGWGNFKMRNVLGVDLDTGARVCHGKYTFNVEHVPGLLPQGASVPAHDRIYLTGPETRVLAEADGAPTVTAHRVGEGCGVYLSGFRVNPENTRMLLNLMLWASGRSLRQPWLADTPKAECAWFPEARKLVVINNSGEALTARVSTDWGEETVELAPCGIEIRER